jgi:hypothetical protein
MSFRQTIKATTYTDRGFIIEVNQSDQKILVSFNAQKVASKHEIWLKYIENTVGLRELNPQPYWGFDDLSYKAGSKLGNCFYVQAKVKRIGDTEYYHYNSIHILEKFKFNHFIQQMELGNILIDFDARTGHNHGTKFRVRQKELHSLYEKVIEVL